MRREYRELDPAKKILITGGAGFIGFHLSIHLLKLGCLVVGFDNMNCYYDVKLKESRLAILMEYHNYRFVKGDLADEPAVNELFYLEQPNIVVNLAAQAGVRYSIENPKAYMDSNIMGFFNILEACRYSHIEGNTPVEHLLFASSSSVYGNQQKVPFSITDDVDKPISLYAATKKSNELMAYTYSHLYHIPTTGLRFFTVYGPFGRPDMAYFSFTQRIVNEEPIKIFNQGDLYRDFTYVDDIVEGVKSMLCNPPLAGEDGNRYKIYNIGNHKPVKLMDFISTLELLLGKNAIKEFLPMQPGDVYQTFADVEDLIRDFDFKPNTNIYSGLKEFVRWYKKYYEYQL